MDINDIDTSSSSIAINEHNIIIDIVNSKNKNAKDAGINVKLLVKIKNMLMYVIDAYQMFLAKAK